MKKIILFAFMSTAVFSTLFAQIKFMPKAGLTLAEFQLGGAHEKIKPKIGFVLGVAVEIPLIDEKVSLQPELFFQQNGAKSVYTDVGYSVETTSTLNYISIPILAKVKFGKFFAEAGPSFGFGIGGKYEITVDDYGDIYKQSGKLKFGEEPSNSSGDDRYIDNAFDFGLQMGVGMNISVIVIDIRYGLGLSNMNDAPDGYIECYKTKINSLQLTVGIPLGGKK